MGKSSGSSAGKKTNIFIIILIIIAIPLIVWKLQGKFGLTFRKIDLTGVMPERSVKSQSVYDQYQVSSANPGGDAYYTSLKDVVCDAAPDLDGTKRYFRISITFESPDKKSAEKLAEASETLVADLRLAVSNLRLGSEDRGRVMEYIKTNMANKIKMQFGKDAVTDIYFEEIISQ